MKISETLDEAVLFEKLGLESPFKAPSEVQKGKNVTDWEITEESLRLNPVDESYYTEKCDCDFDSYSSEFEFNSYNPIHCSMFSPFLQKPSSSLGNAVLF